jgi:simple sugar transport system ATP-binding protein
MAYIPEDRLRTGLAPLGDLEDNLLMGYQYAPDFSRMGFLRRGAVRSFAAKVLQRYGVAAASSRVQSGTLSGGNMQRLVMGRELEQNPRVLMVSQPTRGVDVGGISAIHDHLLRLRSLGRSILLISSSLEEILALSDRVGVMVKGRFVAVLSRREISKDRIGALMLQGRDESAEGGTPHALDC